MDEACSSNEPFAIVKMNEILNEDPVFNKKTNEQENMDMANNDDVAGPSEIAGQSGYPPDLVPKHEVNTHIMKIRKIVKKRRLDVEPDIIAGETDPIAKFYTAHNIILNYTEECGNLHPIDAINLIKMKEKRPCSSWLLLSSIDGGWNYSETKNFLLTNYRIYYIVTKRGLEIEDEMLISGDINFRAVVKFVNKAEMDLVFRDLIKRELFTKFIFCTFDSAEYSENAMGTDNEDGIMCTGR